MRKLVACVFALTLVLLWTSKTSTTSQVLVAKGATWKYLDTGVNQGTAWYAPGFNDAGWPAGPAQLGYGDGDEATVVSFGSNSSAKYITTYFRRTFTVNDPSLFQSLTLNLLRDDGAVAYLNGTEVFRTNMPTGSVSSTTLAVAAIGGTDEATFYSASISPALLTAGANVLAVELHQANATSSDVSFDAELVASTGLQITRGPYLQLGTSSGIVVRWRTGGPSDSVVRYGLDPQNLTLTASSATQTTEHEVPLSGLVANTQYFYSVGSTTQTLAGGDAAHAFFTSPQVGTAIPTRVWVLGDSGTADQNARAVRDAYYTYTGATRTNLWLMLGDNAYDQGLDTEFQPAVFDMYPTMLRQSTLWPTLGNHDGAAANSSLGTGPYYDIFTLPKQAQAGGVASGTEAYYSFDYSNIHFICLESFETNRAVGSPMLSWLQSDLASTSQQWIVAFWHHPPYSKGSHDSDTDTAMSEMRQNVLPILEGGGVDLVLAGHSHSYERSFLLDGHYGVSSTLAASMKLDSGSGREGDTGAYRKQTVGLAPHEGAVYSVAGSSGKIGGGALNHPAMFVSLNVLGSMVLDVDGTRLDAKFIDNTGAVRDSFTIVKGAAPLPLSITTTSLPGATVGTSYTSSVVATGGVLPYTWSVSSGALPAGLTLASTTGAISGVPLGPAGTSSFSVRVADSTSPQQAAVQALSIAVAAGSSVPGAFSKSTPKNGGKNQGTAVTLQWAASAGATSYEYCVDTTNDGACAGTWATVGTARQASLAGLARRTTYSWQVRARNTGGVTLANGGTWWSFTTR